jgi:ribosomal protein S27AE
MKDGIPEVSDFGAEEGTPTCPKCGTMMDRGTLDAGQRVFYSASQAPGSMNAVSVHALACINCGYVELVTDPEALRCLLAGVKPPKDR